MALKKLSNCAFHQSKIVYLGYRISHEGIEMDPKKVKAVLEWACPIPKSNCKLFGICKLLLPIDPLIRSDRPPHHQSVKDEGKGKPKSSQPLKWTIRVPGSVQKTRTLFAAKLVLKHSDCNAPFIIQAEASDMVLGQSFYKRTARSCVHTSPRS